jgi:hypothetical protein
MVLAATSTLIDLTRIFHGTSGKNSDNQGLIQKVQYDTGQTIGDFTSCSVLFIAVQRKELFQNNGTDRQSLG